MAKRSSTWDSALSHFRPLITAQGEVGYAYNLLQETFFNLFILVVNLERPIVQPSRQPEYYPYALALWHVFQNDKLQRQLAITALEKLPTELDIKGGIRRLLWAQKQADKLAEYRNLIIHTPMRFRYVLKNGKSLAEIPSIGGFSTKPINMKRLRAIKTVQFWKTLRNDFLNLNDYVEFVTRQIAWREYERQTGRRIVGAQRSWPHRPRLPSVRRIGSIESMAKNTPISAPRRSKRRRPSGARPPGQS
jgi:hypothetical protein